MTDEMSVKDYFSSRARTAPGYPHPGESTAVGSNVSYRLGKLEALGLINGAWLDCGCAEGGYTEALIAFGADSAIGIDPEPHRIAEALKRNNRKADYHCCTADKFPLPDRSVDQVLLNEVLEHVADEAATLREIRRVLKRGGRLIVVSPNRWFPFEAHGMRFFGRDFGFPIPFLPWLPGRLSARVMAARNYWPHELRDLVAAAGFEILVVDFVLPVFELYQWLPKFVIAAYRRMMPFIEKTPFRRFGVSTLIVATPTQEQHDRARLVD